MNEGDWQYMREQFNGLRDDMREMREAIKDLRNELQTTFMRHDESDNKRFAELFERLHQLEITRALFHAGEEQDAEEAHRAHGWAVTRMLTIGTLIGGAGAELLHQIIAFFTQRGH